MVLTAKQCVDHIEHTVPGGLPAVINPLQIINTAGEFLVSKHPWAWLERPSVPIPFRAAVSFTTATWTESSRTLTQVGAFAGYTFLTGDRLEIASGTGVTQGEYTVESRTDDDSIVLAVSPSTAGVDLATGDIVGTVRTSSVALPDDFMEVISIDATDSINNSIYGTTYQEILRRRTNQITFTDFHYLYTIVHGEDAAAAGGEPKPRLELWPTPTSTNPSAFTLFYRRGWRAVTAHTDAISIPRFVEGVFIQLVRAVARGYEMEELQEGEGGMAGHLMTVLNGPQWAAAVERDGSMQVDYGPMLGGAVQRGPAFRDWGSDTIVPGPA